MSDQVSIPVQKRSIEKRNRILNAAFELFNEKGFYDTNTAEIAKKAGVSTGILYRYFIDKKTIFLEVIDKYFNNFFNDSSQNLFSMFPAIRDLNDNKSKKNDKQKIETSIILNHILELSLETHRNISDSIFTEIEAMAHYDKDVAQYFEHYQEKLIEQFAQLAHSLNPILIQPINEINLHEKIHFIYNLYETYCHELIYNKRECTDYEALHQLVLKTSVHILTD